MRHSDMSFWTASKLARDYQHKGVPMLIFGQRILAPKKAFLASPHEQTGLESDVES